MNKAELVDAIASKTGSSKKAAETAKARGLTMFFPCFIK